MTAYQPVFQTTSHLYKLLETISALHERIQNSLIKIPWVPSLVREARARMAWGSTAIEGCTLSLEAVQGLLEGREAVGYPDRDVRMAQNYLKALSWIQKRGKNAPITQKNIFQLHKMIANEAVDEGPIAAYRRRNVRAGLHVAQDWQAVPKLMNQLLAWLNGPAGELPAIFSSAILHLRFVEIHPFRDGNGRLARLLATWELYRKGFDTLHVFALDEYFLEHRNLYIKNLQRVQVEKQNLGGWLEFVAEALLDTLERVEKRIMAIGIQHSRPISLTLRQEKLLRFLREKGQVAIREMARHLKVTVPGAHYILKPLIQNGLVHRQGSHKLARYLLGK